MLEMRVVIAFLVILAHYYCCLSCSGCYTKIPHTRWFKQVCHSSRGWKVQDQGTMGRLVSGEGLFPGS